LAQAFLNSKFAPKMFQAPIVGGQQMAPHSASLPFMDQDGKADSADSSSTCPGDQSADIASTSTCTVGEARPVSCTRCKDRPPVCFKCKGDIWQSCRRCKGTGELKLTWQCWCMSKGKGKGKGSSEHVSVVKDSCRKCQGSGKVEVARPCRDCSGDGLWQCQHCNGRGLFPCGACGRGQVERFKAPRKHWKPADMLGPKPESGMTVTRCADTEITQLLKFWGDRGGQARLLGVWSIQNPFKTWQYGKRRTELEELLGHPPAELRGFHGSAPRNILSIAQNGFDSGRRSGQAFGAGEYFAKDPRISISYCRGGSYMLICQLLLGQESTTEENDDGDHVWVQRNGYYVISEPSQALPMYIVRFESASLLHGEEAALTTALSKPVYRVGAIKDERMIDFKFENIDSDIAALPAAWWNGDVTAFRGLVVFDPDNPHGFLPMSKKVVKDKLVLVRRGQGKFAVKVSNALSAGARALLVVQSPGAEDLMEMKGVEPGCPSLAAAMVDCTDGELLMKLLQESRSLRRLVSASRRGTSNELPPNRPCAMMAKSTDSLWLGFLHPHFSDEQLSADVRCFLAGHGPAVVRIVRGKFTQAKVALTQPIAQDEVLAFNSKTFTECGVDRQVTVDDAHGSPGQRCPRSIAGYCRGQNLRFVDPCWCSHDPLPTAGSTFTMKGIDLASAKGDEIRSAFMRQTPFHNGMPQVLAICSVHNRRLESRHEFFRRYLTEKNGEAPRQVELYHGTNLNILDTVYTHGLFPPSDMEASEDCPLSGGKGLRTSLCQNTCEFCTERHHWDRCHMFGLGIYLGDMAQKSHRYVSGVQSGGEHKMVVCSVLLGDALQVEGHLRCGDAMHDLQSLRGVDAGDLPKMVDSTRPYSGRRPVEQKDILFVKGLGACCRPGFSVFNSEFISFHPYQCMPLYEITYTI